MGMGAPCPLLQLKLRGCFGCLLDLQRCVSAGQAGLMQGQLGQEVTGKECVHTQGLGAAAASLMATVLRRPWVKGAQLREPPQGLRVPITLPNVTHPALTLDLCPCPAKRRDRDLGDCPGPALWFGGQQGRATHCQHRARMDHDAWHDCSWSFMEQRPELGTTWLRAAQRDPQSCLASAEPSSTAHGQGDGAQHRLVGPSTSSVPAEAGWQERGGRSEAQHFTLGAWFPGWYRPAWEG